MSWKFWQKGELNKNSSIITVMIVFLIVLALGISIPVAAYEYTIQSKIYRGVQVDGLNVGGLTKDQARTAIDLAMSQFDQRGIGVRYNGSITVVKLSNIGLNDPDLAYDVVNFNPDKIIETAYSFGRSGAWADRILDQLSALISGHNVPSMPSINEDKIDDMLSSYFPMINQIGKEPQLVFDGGKVSVLPEVAGVRLDIAGMRSQLEEQINLNHSGMVDLKLTNVTPALTRDQVLQHLDQVKALLDKKVITLTHNDKKWEISVERFEPYLEFADKDGVIELSFKRENIDKLLSFIAEQVNVPPKDAVMEVADNRVTSFIPSEEGLELKVDQTLANIEKDIIKGGKDSTEAVVDTAKPKVEIKDINNLGITELLGTGESDYSGSPYNRRINIAVGAKAVDGVIVAPGEEFSLLKTLGEVDGEHGYKQELVIKGNKTLPEYGGGLCQIGTTTFRGALKAGVNITMRANHSYRVGYYEPAGTDATIYSPAPDFKFINDTPAHILIRTINDTKKSKLYFQFWGTSDGRIVDLSKPVVYNIVPPPPGKLIETLDLKPGVKKCTEHAHNGANATFTETITSADGTKNEIKFNSHYKPWQEVCLIGVEKLSNPTTPDETPVSSDSTAVDANVNANVNSSSPANTNSVN